MEVDLDSAPDGTNYSVDVCIAGAGIAGLVLAEALIGSGLRVALLEAGGKTLEARSQQLYTVEMAGHPHSGASEGRFRTFGGSSTRWGGQLLSYTDDVFHPPAATHLTGWPIDNVDLRPFYPRVLNIMGVPEDPFAAASFLDETKPVNTTDDVQVRYARWAPFTRRSLTGTLRPPLPRKRKYHRLSPRERHPPRARRQRDQESPREQLTRGRPLPSQQITSSSA